MLSIKKRLIQYLATRDKQANSAFTLVELIVVVVIIGILSAIAIPSFQNAGDKAKQKEASVLVNNYLKAAQAFFAEYGYLPEYSRDLGNFITVTGCRTHDQTYCKNSPLEDFSNRPLRVWYIPSGDMRIYSYKTNIRQKKYTIHPELLDKSGNITQEELLTVRFSNDTDSTLEEKGTTTD